MNILSYLRGVVCHIPFDSSARVRTESVPMVAMVPPVVVTLLVCTVQVNFGPLDLACTWRPPALVMLRPLAAPRRSFPPHMDGTGIKLDHPYP